MSSFRDVKVGDTVRRMLAGVVPMELTVTEVSDDLITCGAWTFDRDTGAEIDHDLKWGPQYGRTGSYLVQAPGPSTIDEDHPDVKLMDSLMRSLNNVDDKVWWEKRNHDFAAIIFVSEGMLNAALTCLPADNHTATRQGLVTLSVAAMMLGYAMAERDRKEKDGGDN